MPDEIDPLVTANTDITAALGLLSPDDAEQIIGPEPAPEYGVLLRGVRAVSAMHCAVLRCQRRRNSTLSYKPSAQALIMLLQIVNYAYALGLKRGREEDSDA